jgi:hypothetical protein
MTPPRVTLLDIAQTLAAYVAIPVALVYPFGFVALFLQFMKYFGLEAYTAWYAVSVVNKTVVMGQGATILLVALLGNGLLAGLVCQILLWHDNRHKNKAGAHRPGLVIPAGLVLVSAAMALVLYVLCSRILAAGRVSWSAVVGRYDFDECHEESLRHQLNLWPDSLVPAFIFICGGLLGGALIYGFYQEYCRRPFADRWNYPRADRPLRSIAGLVTTIWSFSRGIF